jgi:hypothetical protein
MSAVLKNEQFADQSQTSQHPEIPKPIIVVDQPENRCRNIKNLG